MAPKKPLVAFKIFFLLFREATAFTDLGMTFQFGLTGGVNTSLVLANSYELVISLYYLFTKHSFHSWFIGNADHGRAGQAQFGILVLIPHPVGRIGLKTLNLTGTGNLKTLFCAAMGLHLWHGLVDFLFKRTAKIAL